MTEDKAWQGALVVQRDPTHPPHSWSNCPSVKSSPHRTLQHSPHQHFPSPRASGAGAGGWKPKKAQQEASPDWGHITQPLWTWLQVACLQTSPARCTEACHSFLPAGGQSHVTHCSQ